ncbi:uncharacterized protein LOC127409770 isoform X3 [Myxocyprinus asiaticus]|uniref:uncharacterized protein LOC127409770 isoform X3 n=1 Tax=Myxocyprinus asiaticus TaxID=70543 RepID=UPI0022213FB9|nr:uncharacterized protein LOC127409770 isoform X3 [Myxocyprinus asiaticus]
MRNMARGDTINDARTLLKYLLGFSILILLIYFNCKDGPLQLITRAGNNECLNSSLVCGPNADCYNFSGNYTCSCWIGYNAVKMNETVSGSNPCIGNNECLNSLLVCGPNADCYNYSGNYACSCWSGYNVAKMNETISSSNPCTDVDECLVSSSLCGPNSTCRNIMGGYNCSCLAGFTASNSNLTISINNTCKDVDECVEIPDVCGPNSICNNTIGNYNCSCMSGYNVTDPNLPINSSNQCRGNNECLNSSLVCGPNADCYNFSGNYTCFCWSGYNVAKMNETISSSNPCRPTDVDECLVSSSLCGPNSTCRNIMGGYSCSCLDGFTATNSNLTISINNTCRDVDECVEIPNVCGPNSICNNTIGNYNCSCMSGYNVTDPNLPINSSNQCRGDNECLNSSLVCGPNADCYNFSGNYTCSCWSGYNVAKMNETISSSNPCRPTDVDECLVSSSLCGPNSTCRNIMGGYNCSCLDGFTATNSNLTISINNTCRDVDECVEIPDVCGPKSICNNTIGNYNCSCMSGYHVTDPNLPINSSNQCRDINECQVNLSICGPNSTCTNGIADYIYIFLVGLSNAAMPELIFTINRTCTDVFECQVDLSIQVCGLDSTCTNNIAGYIYKFFAGFTATMSNLTIGINKTCKDVNECQLNLSICGLDSTCTNNTADYIYNFLVGFTTIMSELTIGINKTCKDVDKCQVSLSIQQCGSYSKCKNNIAGYIWYVLAGYIESELTIRIDMTCKDVDECLVSLYTYTAPKFDLTIAVNNTCKVSTVLPTISTTPTRSTTPTITTTPTTTTPTTTITTAISKVITMSMRIDENFDTSLTSPTDEKYKFYANNIKSAIESSYSTMPNYIKGSAKVTGFRAGSIISDFTISSTTSTLDFGTANAQVSNILKNAGITLAQNAFAQTEQTTLSTITGKLYPLQKVELNCAPPESVQGEIKWTVNEKDPADSTKYSIVNRTLIVNSASQSDSGRYSCIIQRNSIPYILWQNIAIEQLPTINVGENVRFFPCDDLTVHLSCCIDAAYNIEWVLNGAVQNSVIESGCITLNHGIQKVNCKNETFTCRLKDLPQLLDYSYSSKSVTVKTSTEKFDCKNESLGFGQQGATVTGPCGKGKEGSITYECQLSGNWTQIHENCVPQVIKELERKSKFLVVEDIPVFLANLSDATVQNINEITQSTETVKTIVDMLSKIADISQNITINKPVMKNFLKTVDNIISDKVKNTWQNLTLVNTTENTNIKLLQAVETISGRLSNEVFTINETSIQLNRTQINNSFSGSSQLPNSTTLIEIPDVPQPTAITIIVFSTLDNVLPTRNINNETGKSGVQINGDVVVIKVNETINNISFTFDITNKSLGIPQCVFWNFYVNGWDSTGCEVRPLNESGKVKCECNHTTSFSILMSPFAIKIDALAYITYIGVAISMASLILCLIIEIIVWNSVTRNDTSYMRHVSIVNIAVSLLIADICFIIGAAVAEQEQPTSVGRCSPAVFFMQFFYLALFFWMLISALLLFYRTVMVLSQMSRRKMMAIAFIVGYGAPLLIAVITVASTAGPQKYITKTNACWLNWNESKALLAFVIPALTIVAVNLLVLIVVLFKMLIRGVVATTQPDEKHALVVIARCVAILTPIFGLTWGFGIGTMVSSALGIHVVFAILNSLQGFFILVFGTLLDSKIRESLAGKLSLKNISSNRSRSTTAGPSSSGMGFFDRIRRRKGYNVPDASASSAATSSNNYSASNTFTNT